MTPTNSELEEAILSIKEQCLDLSDTGLVWFDFNQAKALIQEVLDKQLIEALTNQREDIRKQLPERKPDLRGTKFREYHGWNDLHDQITKILDKTESKKTAHDTIKDQQMPYLA